MLGRKSTLSRMRMLNRKSMLTGILGITFGLFSNVVLGQDDYVSYKKGVLTIGNKFFLTKEAMEGSQRSLEDIWNENPELLHLITYHNAFEHIEGNTTGSGHWDGVSNSHMNQEIETPTHYRIETEYYSGGNQNNHKTSCIQDLENRLPACLWAWWYVEGSPSVCQYYTGFVKSEIGCGASALSQYQLTANSVCEEENSGKENPGKLFKY